MIGAQREQVVPGLRQPGGALLDSGELHRLDGVDAERFDDGVFDQKALDGWALEMRNIHGIGDLCPECYKVYRETMNRFYEGGRHGG